jgi:hypothetical protein
MANGHDPITHIESIKKLSIINGKDLILLFGYAALLKAKVETFSVFEQKVKRYEQLMSDGNDAFEERNKLPRAYDYDEFDLTEDQRHFKYVPIAEGGSLHYIRSQNLVLQNKNMRLQKPIYIHLQKNFVRYKRHYVSIRKYQALEPLQIWKIVDNSKSTIL